MTVKLKRTIIFLIFLIIIVISAMNLAFWYFGKVNQDNDLQRKETSFSDIEIHNLYPGTNVVSNIKIEIPVEMVPERMMVFSKQPITDAEILEIADDLGVVGKPVNESGWIFIQNGYNIFSSQPGGRVITYDNETPITGFSPDYIVLHLPSDDEAKKIADKFLSVHDIVPDGMKFVGTSHNVGYYSDRDSREKNSESINVMYRHFINGFEIFNDKLGLEVTINKTVKTMFWKWTRYRPYREYPIITPEQSVDYLQKTGLVVPKGIEKPERAEVRNITLGYLGETYSRELDYLIPVYKIEGIVYGNGTAEFFQYVPASPSAMAEIV